MRPTAERNIAQVFQFPVVYDTMTVRENLAFPLRNRGMDAAYIAARVAQIAQMIGMEENLNRKARGLTADAKQKITPWVAAWCAKTSTPSSLTNP